MLEEKLVPVGERGIDDKRKRLIEGVLIRPDKGYRDIGILFVAGWNGFCEDYVEYFSRRIGERLPIYTTELRHLGWAFGQTLVDDIVQVDDYFRNLLGTNRILYFGHSMGLPIAVEASRQHSRPVSGYLGMAAYPYIAKLNIGPLAYPIRYAKIKVDAHFVIAENDWLLFNILRVFVGNREKFENYFGQIGSYKLIPGNHWFNQKLSRFRPYNKDNPEPLLQQAFSFVERFV